MIKKLQKLQLKHKVSVVNKSKNYESQNKDLIQKLSRAVT